MSVSETEDNGASQQTPRRDMISSDQIIGSAVFADDGEKVGKIDRLLIDPDSAKIEYAIVSPSGLLAIAAREHPVPWQALAYRGELEGYLLKLNKRKLEEAPGHAPGENPAFDEAYARSVFGFYGLPWGTYGTLGFPY